MCEYLSGFIYRDGQDIQILTDPLIDSHEMAIRPLSQLNFPDASLIPFEFVPPKDDYTDLNRYELRIYNEEFLADKDAVARAELALCLLVNSFIIHGESAYRTYHDQRIIVADGAYAPNIRLFRCNLLWAGEGAAIGEISYPYNDPIAPGLFVERIRNCNLNIAQFASVGSAENSVILDFRDTPIDFVANCAIAHARVGEAHKSILRNCEVAKARDCVLHDCKIVPSGQFENCSFLPPFTGLGGER